MLSIEIRSGVPLYEQIEKRLTELIGAGSMSENEKLPAVREIAKELGVNPNTVQKAYQSLEQKGLIYSLPSKGSYVSKGDTALEAVRTEALKEFRVSVVSALKCGVSADILHNEIRSKEGEV